MKTELVDVSDTRKNLVVEIPADRVDAELSLVTSRYGKAARLPGFRPGKVPAKVIRQRFKGQILQDAAEHLVGHAVEDALSERGLQPIESPDIQNLVVKEGEPLTFTASFDVVPPFDPGDLSAIELRKTQAPIEDEAVGQALERLRDRAARFEPVERGVVETGHTAVVDLVRQGTDKDGKPWRQVARRMSAEAAEPRGGARTRLRSTSHCNRPDIQDQQVPAANE